MNTLSQPAPLNVLAALRYFLRRLVGGRSTRERLDGDAGSYVGLFRGIIETAAPDAQSLPSAAPVTFDAPGPAHRPQAGSTARASGFLRLEVNDKKKATGCFMFFMEGKVLTGAIEGASEQAGFVDASFRLSTDHPHGSGGNGPRPVAAVGKLHLEARHSHGEAAPGEELTIRFV